MSEISKISWTDATWNPTTGCTKVSLGCINCYAEKLALELQKKGNKKYANGFNITLHSEALKLPLEWKEPKKIFVNSMSDLFHKDVPDEYILKVWEVMEKANWHTFQILTKRPERMLEFVSRLGKILPNVWLGTTVENKQVINRIDLLRITPAQIRFLSCEPLLESLGELNLHDIHWVIVGGESGPLHRLLEANWVREIRDQCLEKNIAFFFKQWGGDYAKQNGNTLDGKTHLEFPEVKIIKEVKMDKQIEYDLDEIVKKVQDSGVKNEESPIKTIILFCAGSLVMNAQKSSFNLMVNSMSGSGKDYIVNKTLNLWDPQRTVRLTRISPNVLTYYHANDDTWTWDDKILYLEDVNYSVLNSTVFKVMCSGKTNSVITTSFKAEELKVNGKPIIIVTCAQAELESEMTRRFGVVNLDESKEQTISILEKIAAETTSPELPDDLVKYISGLKPWKCEIPYAKEIVDVFPKNIQARTGFSRFLDLIKASAVFHQYTRQKLNNETILANRHDYEYAREVFQNLSNEAGIALTSSQKEVLEILETGNKTLDEIALTLGLSDRQIRNILKILQYNKLIRLEPREVEEYGKIKRIKSYKLTEKENMLLPKFEELGIASFPITTASKTIRLVEKRV